MPLSPQDPGAKPAPGPLRHGRFRVPFLPLRLLLITLFASAAASVAIASANVSGTYPPGWTQTDVIKNRCSLRLVQPEWFGRDPDLLLNWFFAETLARLGLITLVWLAGCAVLLWRYPRRHAPSR
jgi:hypothetical protein